MVHAWYMYRDVIGKCDHLPDLCVMFMFTSRHICKKKKKSKCNRYEQKCHFNEKCATKVRNISWSSILKMDSMDLKKRLSWKISKWNQSFSLKCVFYCTIIGVILNRPKNIINQGTWSTQMVGPGSLSSLKHSHVFNIILSDLEDDRFN